MPADQLFPSPRILRVVAEAKGAFGSRVAAAVAVLGQVPQVVYSSLTTADLFPSLGLPKEIQFMGGNILPKSLAQEIDFPRGLHTILLSGYRGDRSLELYPFADTPVEAGQESLNPLFPLFEEAGFDPDELLGRRR